MKQTIAALALAAGAQALATRGNSCCFHLSAMGGPGGVVGQLSDGQNRIGQSGLPEGQFCLSNGGITDGMGRGCILTPPTTQLQCDVGASPTGGFSVGCNGMLAHNGDTTFYACPTGDNGGWNIYTTPVANQPKCVTITLQADNTACRSCSSSSGCPADLPSSFEFPHLIVPVDSAHPNTAYGTQYNGKAAGTVSSIFNFDIPPGDAGKQCTLWFLFPTQAQLQTSSFTYSGSGGFDVALLNGPATTSTTYSNKPGVKLDFGSFGMSPGHAYTIHKWGCPAGQRIGVSLSPKGNQCLTYFQDYNPCPIGMYITAA